MTSTRPEYPAGRPGRGSAIALLLIAALFAAQIALRFNSEINHDTGWYLYVAGGLLDGKQLYTDFVEVNPPLVMWLTVPAVMMSRATGVASVSVLYLLFFAMSAVTLFLSARYLRPVTGISGDARRLLLVLLAAVILFVPGADFGQREHVMVLLFLPWVFLRLARTSGAALHPMEAVAIGVLAAVAICIKPHSLLATLPFEAFLLFRFRNWRLSFAVENVSAAIFVAVYALTLFAWAPVFLSEIVELGVRAYIPYYGVPAYWMAQESSWAILAIILAAVLGRIAGGAYRDASTALLAVGIGFLASYYVQAKGYHYQLLPALMFPAIAAAAAFVGTMEERLEGGMSAVAKLSPALLLAANFASVYPAQIYPYPGRQFEAAVEQYRPGAKSVFIASTSVFQAFPMVVKRNLIWASRFPAQWLVPYVSHRWNDGSLPNDPIVAYALDADVSDLQKFHPDIVFINQSTLQVYVKDGKFDFLKFFERDPRFAAIWSGYEFRGKTGDFAIYTAKAE